MTVLTISQVISALEKIKIKHGDIEVFGVDTYVGAWGVRSIVENDKVSKGVVALIRYIEGPNEQENDG